MDWALRVKVAAGAARGIAYLHEDCNLLFFLLCLLYFQTLTYAANHLIILRKNYSRSNT